MESFTSSEITELAKALINVQRHLQPATKDGTNPFTKSHYATLNSVMGVCRDALLDNGIWLCQHPVPVESGHLGLVTKLTHAESGQWQSSLAVVPLPKADPQSVGICMTYLRRYTLSAMLGIVTEEDTDGECGEKAPKSGTRQRRPLTASQAHERHLDDSTQGKDHENAAESTPEHGHSANLPKIDGVTYQTVTAQDGRCCIVATGNTQAKKELLMGAGFKWNAQRKTWWRYADAV